MKQNYEKRGEVRQHYVTSVMLKHLNTGKISRARMVNFSSGGIYFEADVLLNAGEIIEIGIENSPYIHTEDVIDCYKATVIRRKKLASGVYKYGYGLQFTSAGQSQSAHINGRAAATISTRLHRIA